MQFLLKSLQTFESFQTVWFEIYYVISPSQTEFQLKNKIRSNLQRSMVISLRFLIFSVVNLTLELGNNIQKIDSINEPGRVVISKLIELIVNSMAVDDMLKENFPLFINFDVLLWSLLQLYYVDRHNYKSKIMILNFLNFCQTLPSNRKKFITDFFSQDLPNFHLLNTTCGKLFKNTFLQSDITQIKHHFKSDSNKMLNYGKVFVFFKDHWFISYIQFSFQEICLEFVFEKQNISIVIPIAKPTIINTKLHPVSLHVQTDKFNLVICGISQLFQQFYEKRINILTHFGHSFGCNLIQMHSQQFDAFHLVFILDIPTNVFDNIVQGKDIDKLVCAVGGNLEKHTSNSESLHGSQIFIETVNFAVLALSNSSMNIFETDQLILKDDYQLINVIEFSLIKNVHTFKIGELYVISFNHGLLGLIGKRSTFGFINEQEFNSFLCLLSG
eukprot:TRINITY_DN14486_c0_g1_i1.p1 TRINITY_DN14486_c0_g1~~TRINITY_DN14486_c0_g1_i1.p1  ORF type:complete len:457 (+),score=95.37 TRINITY_DN14486_c0_g1_i1:44-1372(+)